MKLITLSPREWATTKDGKPAKYMVEQVTGSLDYTPGEMIPADVVRDLCERVSWRVTIKRSSK